MNRLDVQTSRLQPVLAAFLALIFVPLGVASLYFGLSKGFSAVPVMIGLLMLATLGGVPGLVRRGHANSVRYFSGDGLQRNDGQWLAWTDLERVVNQVRRDPGRPSQKSLWRTEIRFRDGRSAWLLPMRVGNRREVADFVRGLPCEHVEVNV
jgi:hypothetical protein